jgi:DNA-binding beta-propeller fold protein YncE
VVVYSQDGKMLRTFGKAPSGEGEKPGQGELGEILDVAVGPDGEVYVADQATTSVSVFGPDGNFVREISRETLGVQQLDGIDVAPDGTLLAADPPGMQILALPAASGKAQVVSRIGDPANKLDQTVDVAAGAGGALYAADVSNRIVELAVDGKIVKEWPVSVGKSEGGSRLAVSPDGSKVYMSDPDLGRVDVLNVETGTIDYIGGTGSKAALFNAPSGIAVGPDGLIYVVDRGTNSVQVLEPAK